MKNILLLGSRGFVGKNILKYFSNSNDIAVDAPVHNELDLLDEEAVKVFLANKRYDVVINAAIANPNKNDCSSTSEIEQDLRAFYILEKYNNLYGKMLYFGSGAEFDKSHSISEVKEEDFNNNVPLTQYGLAKYIIGKTIEKSRNIYNLRLFGLFGENENYQIRFISGACAKAVLGLPITIRQNVYFDYLYIDDFCRIVEWFVYNDSTYHTYNVCSGKKHSLLEIASIVKGISNKDIPIYICKDGLAPEYSASNSRLLGEMDYHITDITISIKKMYDYYEKNRDSLDISKLLYQ